MNPAKSQNQPLGHRKAFRLMASLSSKEIKDFGIFLSSPLFSTQQNRRRRMLEFYERAVLLKVWKKDIYKAEFVKGTQIDGNTNSFDKMISGFYDKLNEFISLMAFRKDQSQQHHYALKFYRQRGLEQEEIQKRQDLARRSLEKQVRDDVFFLHQLNFELEKAYTLGNRSIKPSRGRFFQLHHHLDRYYYIRKLRFLCASKNEEYLFSTVDKVPGTRAILEWIEETHTAPLLGLLYYHTYKILSDSQKSEHLEVLLELLKNPECLKFEEDIKDIYGYLVNHYLRRINAGESEFLNSINQLYESLLEHGLILHNGLISQEYFKNIVSIKSRLGKKGETKQFIDKFGGRIIDDFGGLAIQYNYAVLYFHQKEFPKAIHILEELVEATGEIKKDQFYGLDIRSILLKSYFEVLQVAEWSEWDIIDEKCRALLRAFQAYIERRKISGHRKDRFHKFRTLYNELYQYHFGSLPLAEKEANTEPLKRKIREMAILSDRSWFLEKMDLPDGQS